MFPSVLGSGSAVWNHRGLLGSWGWGPSVCRLRRGAHRTNATPGPRHWPRGDCHRCDHGDQRGPSTQGVQLIIALTTEERTETWLDTRGWTANPGWLAKWFSFSFFPFFFFVCFSSLSLCSFSAGRYLRSGNTLRPHHRHQFLSTSYLICVPKDFNVFSHVNSGY